MDQEIFRLEAGVEATSLYILVCALQDQGAQPTVERTLQQWNSSEDAFWRAVSELQVLGVLQNRGSVGARDVLIIAEKGQWRRAQPV